MSRDLKKENESAMSRATMERKFQKVGVMSTKTQDGHAVATSEGS